ncbi:MAG: N-carbamoyl-D-amino-acid hydrolase [Rhodospirillaceae bacterium]|nr:N-carbamoyl-D-amino-acid hydrolase [Rhodospirillaceae bacterium]
MTRPLIISALQMGPTQRADSRRHTLARMIALLERASRDDASLVVFPELAFTTFFPRWAMDDAELLSYFERDMPSAQTQALFDRARELKIGFHVGYAELTPDGKRYNTAIVVGRDGSVLAKYRKVHLPGTTEPKPGLQYQQLEKRYFRYGDLGFEAFRAPEDLGSAIMGVLICNDRRWPEAWRVLGLKGVELVCCGYNSAAYDPYGRKSEDQALRTFHSTLVAQANAYMNSTFAVCVAKAGVEDGAGLIGGSVIVDPNGRIVGQATTLEDEAITAEIDLDLCRHGKEKMFDFAQHRRIDAYGLIAQQVGVVPPA